MLNFRVLEETPGAHLPLVELFFQEDISLGRTLDPVTVTPSKFSFLKKKKSKYIKNRSFFIYNINECF